MVKWTAVGKGGANNQSVINKTVAVNIYISHIMILSQNETPIINLMNAQLSGFGLFSPLFLQGTITIGWPTCSCMHYFIIEYWMHDNEPISLLS